MLNIKDVSVRAGGSQAQRLRHAYINFQRHLPWAELRPAHDGQVVICGAAPSLKDEIANIRRRRRQGAQVWACNGAFQFLLDNGLVPDALVLLDPQSNMRRFIVRHPDVTYLLASQIEPEAVEAAGKNVVLWHSPNDEKEIAFYRRFRDRFHAGRRMDVMIWGNTVGLRAIGMAHLMGYRNIHFYGCDSSVGEGAHISAAGYEGQKEPGQITVHAGDRQFITTVALAKQVEVFKDMQRTLIPEGCVLQAHGRGLLPFVARDMQQRLAQWIKNRRLS